MPILALPCRAPRSVPGNLWPTIPMKTAINPPRTPVTAGSKGTAAATLPNVCKMPGPPAPFVLTPLPNIAKSSINLQGGTKTVKIEGKSVAIRGATFGSTGDIASKATGGGLVSANTHGPAKFVAPGSMNVKLEGKAVHLLGDAMTNNNSNPPNAGTVMLVQASCPPTLEAALQRIAEECEEQVGNFPPRDPRIAKQCKDLGVKKHACCAQKLEDAERQRAKDGEPRQLYSEPAYDRATGKMLPRKNPLPGPPPMVPRTQTAICNQARGFYQSGRSPFRSSRHAIGAMVAGKKFPDVVVPSNPSLPCERGNVAAVYDFKFPCPRGRMPRWGRDRSGRKQRDAYKDLLQPPELPTIIRP
jgi:uncharacterized Zn-binding protein involved in type VI secretion